MKVLVTGGAGFIGSAVVRHLIRDTEYSVINIDKLTYAASPEAIEDCAQSERYAFEQIDICDVASVRSAFARHKPDAVLHLAAESHVDRSIDGPGEFIQTNIVGTFNLVQAARAHYEALAGAARDRFRFHHVSTDEVFGALSPTDEAFHEETPYRPNSPYSASKASSDHIVRAWGETFGLPVVSSNCSNNYGPWQYPEKLIPVLVMKSIDGEPLPIYGTGENIRDWLFVDDHARALGMILARGRLGESYNVGGDAERTNLDVVRAVCREMDALRPENAPHDQRIQFVTDRPGHDFRYAIDARKIRSELGWTPSRDFDQGIRETVRWYVDNEEWWRSLRAKSTTVGQRAGLAAANAAAAGG